MLIYETKERIIFCYQEGGGASFILHFAFCTFRETQFVKCYIFQERIRQILFVYFFEKELDFVYFRGETDTFGLFQERNKQIWYISGEKQIDLVYLKYEEETLSFESCILSCIRTLHSLHPSIQQLRFYKVMISFYYKKLILKALSLCHKLRFSNPYIFETQCRRPQIFQTMNSVR